MSELFEELRWHDAVLLELRVDRSRPGEVDRVSLHVCWPDDEASFVHFDECYAMKAELNFGVVALESILSARVADDVEELEQIRAKWAAHEVRLDDLRCYEVMTNSTASCIRVFARRFSVSSGR